MDLPEVTINSYGLYSIDGLDQYEEGQKLQINTSLDLTDCSAYFSFPYLLTLTIPKESVKADLTPVVEDGETIAYICDIPNEALEFSEEIKCAIYREVDDVRDLIARLEGTPKECPMPDGYMSNNYIFSVFQYVNTYADLNTHNPKVAFVLYDTFQSKTVATLVSGTKYSKLYFNPISCLCSNGSFDLVFPTGTTGYDNDTVTVEYTTNMDIVNAPMMVISAATVDQTTGVAQQTNWLYTTKKSEYPIGSQVFIIPEGWAVANVTVVPFDNDDGYVLTNVSVYQIDPVNIPFFTNVTAQNFTSVTDAAEYIDVNPYVMRRSGFYGKPDGITWQLLDRSSNISVEEDEP